MVFVLLTPKVKQQNQHLAYLAHLAEVFSDHLVRKKLLETADITEVLALLEK